MGVVSAKRSELLKGARFGQHEVVRFLGHGATASVFEGRHVALGKPVALKILHEHLAADDEVSGRFVREGQIAAQLRHPNVLDVLDVGVEAGMPYLVMELLQGEDLRTHLREHGILPTTQALALILPVLSALAHAHDAGAVHRDLKPANIFLAHDVRGDVIPKLVDFGLSKIVGAGAENGLALTATDVVVGTMLYMAPEQSKGSKFAGPKSDQYAMAVTLYECLTGRVPFEADGFYALLDAIRSGFAKPPSLVDPRIPEGLDAVVLRALNRDPDKRFASVRGFARALSPFADEQVANAWARDFVEDAPAAAQGSRPRITAPQARASSPAILGTDSAATSAVRACEPLPCAPGKGPFHIKGNPYRGLVHLVKHAIPGGLDAVCDALEDARLRDFLRQPFLASGRYDIFPIAPLTAAIATMLGQTTEALLRASSPAQARYDARTVFMRLYDVGTTAEMVSRIARFGSQYYDFGKYTGVAEAPGHLVLQHAGVPKYIYRWYAPMQVFYTEETIRIAGAKHAEGTARPPSGEGTDQGYDVVTSCCDLRWS